MVPVIKSSYNPKQESLSFLCTTSITDFPNRTHTSQSTLSLLDPERKAHHQTNLEQVFLVQATGRKFRPLSRMMAALPRYRVQPFHNAFAHNGVDYFGPIEGTIFRRKVRRWGCLFTCLSFRAFLIEMAYSPDTDSFFSCLGRFEDRHGKPTAYYIDNGTNFVGAVYELDECLQRFEQWTITDQLGHQTSHGISSDRSPFRWIMGDLGVLSKISKMSPYVRFAWRTLTDEI